MITFAKDTRKRYAGKLAWLIRQGVPLEEARRRAAGYAGGKTTRGQPDPVEGDESPRYTQTSELPESVKSALPVPAQGVWMDACNAAHEDGEDEADAAAVAWQAVQNGGYRKEGDKWVKAREAYPRRALGLVDLLTIQLEEISVAGSNEPEFVSEIQIMRTGSWDHPQYGKFTINEDHLQGFVDSFYSQVRGVDLAVDQAHDPNKGAAGWFKDVSKRGGELWAKIAWTSWGLSLIRNKIFRYFSPEFHFSWTDEETKKAHKNVLFGGALTNRPFLKGMDPIMLSENLAQDVLEDLRLQFALSETTNLNPEGGIDMWKELAKLLGMPETATEAEIRLKLAELSKQPGMQLKEIAQGLGLAENATLDDVKAKAADVVKIAAVAANSIKLSDVAKVLGLAETAAPDEVKAKLAAVAGQANTVVTLQERVSALETDNKQLKETAINARWDKVSAKAFTDGRMTAQLSEKFKPLFLADPDGTEAIIAALPKAVNTQGRGHTGAGGTSGSSKLSESQQAICAQLGVTEEQFLKHNPEAAQQTE
ncbi:MAG: ChaB family protein [Clostridia bacterium]|nr:ChaB family protein [Clostridia bacterium]